jgi:hypothetical protein
VKQRLGDAREPTEVRQRWSRRDWILASSIAVPVAAAIYHIHQPTWPVEGPSLDTSKRLFEHRGLRLALPRNHLLHVKREDARESASLVGQALLPDLAPVSRRTWALFRDSLRCGDAGGVEFRFTGLQADLIDAQGWQRPTPLSR